ncbi:MAG: ABC transporter ATP-binding protein [Thermoleophilia bacterium]|nr:ABC transporter ATP-binding protein [Thermoleophilia bacterium]
MAEVSEVLDLSPAAGEGGTGPLVEVRGITKIFPGVVANDGIDLAVYGGEVHCLLGENGAGKSTLMNILSGMYRPDAGTILVDGAEVQIDSPRVALDLGIGTVYQHPTLIPVFTVLENLVLGQGRGLSMDTKRALAGLKQVAADLGVEIDPRALAGRLALGQQQQVEIVKALWGGSRVLILDEPTSMLTPQGITELEKVLLQLKERGLAIIFITHKLHEALDVGDRVTVLRRGRVVGTLGPEVVRSTSRDELQARIVTMMFGEEAASLAGVAEVRGEVTGHRTARQVSSEVMLELIGVSVEPQRSEIGIRDVSLAVRRGEIVGVAGVDGNGQRELAEAVAGQRSVHTGDVLLAGQSIRHTSVSGRQRMGLRYVTDDRVGEGTVSSLSVATNLILKRIGDGPFWKRGRVCDDAISECATDLVDSFDIRTPTIETSCGTLSGGNLQKVLLARELSFDPRVVVYNKPTHGLDVKTTYAVRDRIRQLAEERQVSALLISTDLEELLDLCDRIAVLFGGRLMGVVENEVGAELEVGRLMVGGDSR